MIDIGTTFEQLFNLRRGPTTGTQFDVNGVKYVEVAPVGVFFTEEYAAAELLRRLCEHFYIADTADPFTGVDTVYWRVLPEVVRIEGRKDEQWRGYARLSFGKEKR